MLPKPKCEKCGNDMAEDPKNKGVWKCHGCETVYLTKSEAEKLKSIFTVT